MRSLSKLCVLLLAAGLLIAPASGTAASKSKKKKSKTEEVAKPKVDKYTKMFVNDKSCQTAKGPFLTLHKLKGKLYVEVPLKTIGREMLIASTISEASDTNLGTIGYKPPDPIHVKFTRIDTTIYLSQAVVPPVHDTNDPHMAKAIGRSTLPPIMHAYPLVCYNRDSSAMVIEMTKFFSGDNELIAPIKSTKGGVVNITGKFKSEGSVIDQIKSFEDNVTVKSYLSYSVTADLLGLLVIKKDEPMTVKVTRTILLLPEVAMQPRLADSRIGIFLTGMSRINGKKDKIEDFSVINRWNIQPKDTEAWKRGELVEPVKPIVFYLDDAFPALWREPIRRGVLRWNKAFEKIGFKNVMHIEDFPKDDPDFDPDNLKYSCIRYVPAAVANAMGPSWVDPRSGEIINASVLMYNDVAKLAANWRFVQTSQLDPSVRGKKLPDDVVKASLIYVVAHEVGHCLGFMHNMASSAAFPVDSLRSVSFTQKYGTTPSIMDYARFNYVAQPGDLEKGVKLTPPLIGEYDKFAIKYGYQVLPNVKSADDEKEILRGWVREQIGNKMCFYGKQVFQFNFDPRSMAEDLGDDVVKANTYGLKNLKYVAANFVDWMAVNDEGYAAVESTYKEIIGQFVRFMDHAMVSVGGMYINPKYYGDPEPLYQYVPKAKQIAALKFVLKNLNELQDWIINDKITAIIGPTAKHYVAQTQFFNEMLTRETLGRLQINEVDGKNVFTLDEYLGIIFDEMFTKKTGNLQLADMAFQNSFVENLTGYMDKGEFKSAGSNSLREWLNETTCSCHAYCESHHSFDAVDALGEIVLSPRIDKSNKRPIVMKYLRKTYNTAKSRMNTGNDKTREHYRLLVLKLNYLFD